MSVATPSGLAIRVTVLEQWRPLTLDCRPEETVAAVKGRALDACRIPADRHERYEVKFGGALVRDESATLGQLGVRDGGALVVLSRRRRPVR